MIFSTNRIFVLSNATTVGISFYATTGTANKLCYNVKSSLLKPYISSFCVRDKERMRLVYSLEPGVLSFELEIFSLFNRQHWEKKFIVVRGNEHMHR